MNSKLKQLASTFADERIDAFLVTQDANITYLTDFPASESWLLVGRKKAFYLTDFRYVLEAKKGLHGIPVKRYTKSIFATLSETLKSQKVKRLGFDDRHVSLATFRSLQKHCPKGTRLKTINNTIEKLREVKTSKEIALIKKAIHINLEAYAFIKKFIKPGRTERDVFLKLEHYVKSRKVGFSFDPIIASGPNSCYPHARITDRKIRNNEPVLIDMGIDFQGYKSDLTRMFFLGKIPPLIQKTNEIVREAQRKAIEKIKANIRACEADHAARNYLKTKKLGKYFGHSLGHGVGVEIHEGPRISATNTSILKENMIFTVEPAVYIPHKFGIRIEDMVLVKKKGCEVLSDHFNESNYDRHGIAS